MLSASKLLPMSKVRGLAREDARLSRDIRMSKVMDTIALSRKSRGMSMVTSAMAGGLQASSRCIHIMRRFNDANRVLCMSMEEEMDEPQCHIEFPTGSTYNGLWNVRGMTGNGTYTFPEGGVSYVGGFEDGQFHGQGELRYDNGCVLKGTWLRGQCVQKTLVFADGLEYDEERWKYCIYPDRRYTKEYDNGIEPGGRSNVTADEPASEVPPGYYDVGDGLYNTHTEMVYKHDDINTILRYPCEKEREWIVTNCRRGPVTPVGACPFLYEEWIEPTLELQVPPPAAARTKNAQDPEDDLFYDDSDEDRHWRRLRFSRASRSSHSQSRSHSHSSRSSHLSSASCSRQPSSIFKVQ